MPQELISRVDSPPAAVVADAIQTLPLPKQRRRLPVAALLLWLVVAAGVGFRVNDFADIRSLWRDEAAVALNILDRPFEQLLHPLIRYSTEVKRYSGDVFFMLAIYWCVIWFMQHRTLKRALLLSLVGAVAIWFSYPASFVLIGACIVLVVTQREQKRPLTFALLPILGWSSSVVALIGFQLLGMVPTRPLLELLALSAAASAFGS